LQMRSSVWEHFLNSYSLLSVQLAQGEQMESCVPLQPASLNQPSEHGAHTWQTALCVLLQAECSKYPLGQGLHVSHTALEVASHRDARYSFGPHTSEHSWQSRSAVAEHWCAANDPDAHSLWQGKHTASDVCVHGEYSYSPGRQGVHFLHCVSANALQGCSCQ